jgi:2-amino-4-hydroxy-6-hydroxymethyldihydropteridine diphosphokinase
MPASPRSEAGLNWIPAYVGLGSNQDDPVAQLRKALGALGGLAETRLVLQSPLYRSPPLGGLAQPDYVNAVAALLTRLPAPALLDALLAIEAGQGRRRDGTRWSSRPLDLDLLVYGRELIDEPRLRVPHPGIAARNFVLFPLLDIAPGLEVPGLGPVARLARAAGDAGLTRIEP